MKSKKNIFSLVPPSLLKKLKKEPQPSFVPPMLATLTDTYFSDKNWVYEHKFDGERCFAYKKNGRVRLMSRNDKPMNETYPELVASLEAQQADNFIIDGEIIATTKGISDFQLLQGRMNLKNNAKIRSKQKAIAISYCVFDLLYLDGYDTGSLPLLVRKILLKNLFTYNKLLVYTEHVEKEGLKLFKYACKKGWEGVIAKHIGSTYVGRRSRDWLKFKCVNQQELVIGGYTNPRGSRSDFGALLVGYYKGKDFHYAGKVGTGFSEATLAMLGEKLRKIETKKCPFTNYTLSTQGVHWVKPKLVAEFGFAQWTNGGRLRVGRYRGLRNDKDARSVVKEVPKKL